MTIAKGNKVKIDYTGSFDDGTVFDTSDGKQPIVFEIGANQVIPGFENAMIGMKAGDEKEVVIEPKDGYGEYDKNLIRKVKREQLPKDKEPEKDMVLVIGTPEGHQIPAKIVEVDKDDVTLDMNHPLSGKNLHFKFKVIEVN